MVDPKAIARGVLDGAESISQQSGKGDLAPGVRGYLEAWAADVSRLAESRAEIGPLPPTTIASLKKLGVMPAGDRRPAPDNLHLPGDDEALQDAAIRQMRRAEVAEASLAESRAEISFLQTALADTRAESRGEIERLGATLRGQVRHNHALELEATRLTREKRAAESALAKATAALEPFARIADLMDFYVDEAFDADYVFPRRGTSTVEHKPPIILTPDNFRRAREARAFLSEGAQSETPLSEALKEVGALFDPAEVERVNQAVAAEEASPSLRDAALEDAAKVADERARDALAGMDKTTGPTWEMMESACSAAASIAGRIRALKSPEPKPMTTLEALLARVEKAESGAEVLDLDIHMELCPEDYPDRWSWEEGVRPPHLTNSIDAALALVGRVLPGCWWQIGKVEMGAFQFGIRRRGADAILHPFDIWLDGSFCQTAPLAILAALLRALANPKTVVEGE